jgi:formamidopyrimidine-DNA glycosylase
MPELVEVELYRRLAEATLGRRIKDVWAPDAWYLKRGVDAATLINALTKKRFVAARRIGKLLLLDTDDVTLGLRFGMSGRLVVDGKPGVDTLVYASNAENNKFDRFAIEFVKHGNLVMRDPRRLGGVELNPPEGRLGPDALTVSTKELRSILKRSTTSLKARLMDQAHLAGVGNLAADEMLWRAGLDPARPANSLDDKETTRLARAVRTTLSDLLVRGGSHTGDLMPHRAQGGRCPKDGTPLTKRTIGGRTTWSCPRHQV